MRWAAMVALLALPADAQAPPKTRTAKDPLGRVEVTLPESWEDLALEENQLIHACASRTGGHMLIVTRETGQADVDKQRDRYMQHDGERYPGAEFQKIADPFFGYRMNDQAKNRVLLRSFLKDGADGVVATMSSRLSGFESGSQAIAVLASLRLLESAPAAPEDAGASGGRRVFEKGGRFSYVMPAGWKAIGTEEGEIVALGHKGSSSSATLKIVEEGDQDNPTLILLKVQNLWKRDYANAIVTRETDPPALVARGRKEGWNDFVVAFAAGGRGYTLRLNAREGVFEGFQPVAERMGTSIVLMGDPYRAPKEVPGEVVKDHKKAYVVHASADGAAAADAVVGEMAGFDREWARIAPSGSAGRRIAPLRVILATADTFAEVAHGFGDVPAAYDRASCVVVALPPPTDKAEVARWRGRLYAAVAEAALHRDLPVAAPPWLLAGLSACMEAAGRTGEGASAVHDALFPVLKGAVTPVPLKDVLAYSYGDVAGSESATPAAMSWGYLHLMLFGKGTLHNLYAKWARDLPKATRAAPPFDLGKYADAELELKRHVERELSR